MNQERIKTILKENPKFELSNDSARRKSQLITIEKMDTRAEHQVKVQELIQQARNQTKTKQFFFETRVVEYVEEFYQKYCKVSLSPDQINDIRLLWKDVNFTKSKRDKFYDSPLYKCTFDNLAIRGEESMCEDCHTALWNEIEDLDFYLLEAMNSVTVIGTRFATGKDATISIDYRNNFSATEYCSCGVACDFDKRPIALVTPNPQIVDKLSEPLRAQKYISTDITHYHIARAKDVNKLKKRLAKGETLPDEKYVLTAKGLRINKDGDIVPIKGFKHCGSNLEEVGKYWRRFQDKQLNDEITRPQIPIKVLEDNVTEAIKYSQPIKIFSSGWGEDSVTEIVLNHAFWDVIIFADTGNEQTETYDYIKKFMKTMPKVSRYKVRVVHSRLGKIYDYYYQKKKTMSYTQRDCTFKFKIDPIKDYIKKKYRINPMSMVNFLKKDENGNKIPNINYNPDDRESKKFLYVHQIELGLGINFEESGRRHDGSVWYIKNQFPLIDKKITKKGGDEDKIIKAFGHPIPVKSGCTFCLYSNKPYWNKLRREHPDQYDQAVKFYENAKDSEDNDGMVMKMVVFPTDEEFAQYMKDFPTCGDGEVESGCQCMNGDGQEGQTRNRDNVDDEEYTSKPAYGGGF